MVRKQDFDNFFFFSFLFFFFLKIKANWSDVHETWSSSLKVQKGDVTILRARQLRVQRRGGFLGKIWLLCSDSVKPYWTSILRHSTNASNSAFASPIPKLVLLLLPLLTNGNIIHLRSQTKNLDMMPNHTLSLSSHSIAKFCLSFKNMNIIFLLRLLPWEVQVRCSMISVRIPSEKQELQQIL